jgi:uncharacterized membrane protein required for colicin V production
MSVISLVLDILIAVICLVIIIKNAVRGFIKSFMVLARTVLATLIAIIFCAPVARWIGPIFFGDWAINTSNNAFFATKTAEGLYQISDVFEGVPAFATKIALNFSGIEQDMLTKYFVDKNPATEADTAIVATGVGNALTYVIALIVAFLALFIISEIIFGILGVFLNKISKAPMLKSVNIILGGLIGAVISISIAWLLSKGIQWVINFGHNYYPNIFTEDILNKSVIVKFFLQHDLWLWVKDHLAANMAGIIIV